MCKFNGLLLALCLCFLPAAAVADNVDTIPITGTATVGFASTYGDFGIGGPGLDLEQTLPQGANSIGSCTVGAVCTLTWSPSDAASFCGPYCTGYSSGDLGSKGADFLEPNLVFKGTGFYSGGYTLTMNLTVSGTVDGYQLVDCTAGVGCSLGPEVFAVKINGTGTETLSLEPGVAPADVLGATDTFSGTATPLATTPEPASLFLMTTGLAGVWMKRRSRS